MLPPPAPAPIRPPMVRSLLRRFCSNRTSMATLRIKSPSAITINQKECPSVALPVDVQRGLWSGPSPLYLFSLSSTLYLNFKKYWMIQVITPPNNPSAAIPLYDISPGKKRKEIIMENLFLKYFYLSLFSRIIHTLLLPYWTWWALFSFWRSNSCTLSASTEKETHFWDVGKKRSLLLKLIKDLQ